MSPDLAQQGTAYGDLADRRLTHLFGISDPTAARTPARMADLAEAQVHPRSPWRPCSGISAGLSGAGIVAWRKVAAIQPRRYNRPLRFAERVS